MIAIELLTCVAADVLSVAVRVHEVPVSITTLLNVATFDDAGTVRVLEPSKVHEDEIVIESLAPPDPPTVTVNAGFIATPAAAVLGTLAKVSVAAAEAAPTPTSATPAATINDAAPIPTAERNLENPYLFFMTSPISGRARSFTDAP